MLGFSEKSAFITVLRSRTTRARKLSFSHCFAEPGAESEKLSFYHYFGAARHRTLENSAFVTVLRSSSETQKNQPLSMFWIAPPPPHSGRPPSAFRKTQPLSRFWIALSGASLRRFLARIDSKVQNASSKTLLFSTFLYPTLLYCAVRRAGRRRVGAGHARRRRSLRSASMIIYRPMRKALVSFLTLAA